MPLKAYYDLLSQPCRALYIFLKANNIPYEEHCVALMKGEHLKENFLKLNPRHKVPIIEDDGFILSESVVILQYLAKKYKVADHWYPSDDLMRMRVDEFLHWQHLKVRGNEAMLFRELFMIDPRRENRALDWHKVGELRKTLEKTLDEICSVYLKDRPFLCGQEISIADLIGVCELMQLYGVKEDGLISANKGVSSWMERVKTKLQPHFDAAGKDLFALKDAFVKPTPP